MEFYEILCCNIARENIFSNYLEEILMWRSEMVWSRYLSQNLPRSARALVYVFAFEGDFMEFLITLLCMRLPQSIWSHSIEKKPTISRNMFDSTFFWGFQSLFNLFGVISALFLINLLRLNVTTTELPAPSRSWQNSSDCDRTALEMKTNLFLGKMQDCFLRYQVSTLLECSMVW